MAYSISNAKSDLEAILHGTTLNQVTNLYPLFNRAARTLLLDIDPRETKRLESITNALYDSVYDYPVPADLKGTKIIDVRPQVNRELIDNFSKTFNENFDLYKTNNDFTIEDRYGVKYLRISKSKRAPITLESCAGLTDNGTWAAGDDATNLTSDTLNYISGSSSLNFDLDGSFTSGYLQNSTFLSVNLSEHENISAVFCPVYIPDTSIITSFNLRWGSSATEYWDRTVTSAHPSNSFITGWNLLRFDWNGATQTGSPDSSAIDYLRFTVNYDGTADTDLRLDSITSNLGTNYQLLYYSKYLFRSAAGVWKEEVSADDDLINLDTESYNLLLFKVAEFASQQVQGSNGMSDIQYFANEYEKALSKYRDMNPSESMQIREPYYTIPKPLNYRSYKSL